jgi:MFS family permease
VSLRMKLLLNAVIGGWGGFAAWVILDLVLKLVLGDLWLTTALNGAVVGMCIGAPVSSFDGLTEGRPLLFIRGIVVGALFGLMGGVSGLLAAQAIYQAGISAISSGWLSELLRIPGWAIFGMAIGMMEGVQMLSFRRVWMGGMGGIIGGVVGGLGFVLVDQFITLRWSQRVFGFVLLGASVGFFAILLPILFRRAWIRVASGRDESHEFLLDKRVNSIGSSDFRDVRVRDAMVAPKHAEVRVERGQFVIYAQPNQALFVNESPTQASPLQDGTKVRVGNTKLTFRRIK